MFYKKMFSYKLRDGLRQAQRWSVMKCWQYFTYKKSCEIFLSFTFLLYFCITEQSAMNATRI